MGNHKSEVMVFQPARGPSRACQGTVPWQAHIGMMVIVVKMGGA